MRLNYGGHVDQPERRPLFSLREPLGLADRLKVGCNVVPMRRHKEDHTLMRCMLATKRNLPFDSGVGTQWTLCAHAGHASLAGCLVTK
jgi:hypothetical protein